MTPEPYHLEYHAAASAQIPGLPAAAYIALVERLVAVKRDPYADTFADTLDDPALRSADFGEYGLVAFYVDNGERRVTVYNVTWTG